VGFRCGIVGLPNVGKSSLFNALTNAGVDAANYPFCTIEPNVGVVAVPDPRLERLAAIVQPKKSVPTTMQFVDIAGLVAGASRGEGLGNQFLAHIRETQAIAHVVRCFDDPNVSHVADTIDPARDIETIRTELALADLATASRALERVERQARTGDKAVAAALRVLERVMEALDQGRPLGLLVFEGEARALVEGLNLLGRKPVLYVANVPEADLAGNDYSARVDAIAAAEGSQSVVICAALEAEIAALDPQARREFLIAHGIAEPGLDRLIRAGYSMLALQTFFTTGAKECRAWTIRRGATAWEAAGVVHTDFQRGFIRAEVIAYEDFVACGGEQGAREQGRWRLEGRDYPVSEGDVVRFRFNV
jgi:GTP-binding protein YchF